MHGRSIGQNLHHAAKVVSEQTHHRYKWQPKTCSVSLFRAPIEITTVMATALFILFFFCIVSLPRIATQKWDWPRGVTYWNVGGWKKGMINPRLFLVTKRGKRFRHLGWELGERCATVPCRGWVRVNALEPIHAMSKWIESRFSTLYYLFLLLW